MKLKLYLNTNLNTLSFHMCLSQSLCLVLALSLLLLPSCKPEPVNQALYEQALENGKSANEGYRSLELSLIIKPLIINKIYC